MGIWEILTDGSLWPFQVSFFVMLGMAGLFVTGTVDHLLDSVHIFDGADAVMEKVATLLHIGKVPMSALLMTFFTFFTAGGFSFATTWAGSFGTMPPTLLSLAAGFASAIVIGTPASRLVAMIMPKQVETDSFSSKALVWRQCEVLSAPTAVGLPGEAVALDPNGRKAYLLVYAKPDEELKAGPAVIVSQDEEGRYVASNESKR